MSSHLWRSRSAKEKKCAVSGFLQLSASQLAALSRPELALLAQWVFEQRGILTQAVRIRPDYIDLELYDPADFRRELARFYVTSPVAAIYHVTTDYLASNFRKIYLLTLGQFSPADRAAANQYPLFLVLYAQAGFLRLLDEARSLAQNTPYKDTGGSTGHKPWSKVIKAVTKYE